MNAMLRAVLATSLLAVAALLPAQAQAQGQTTTAGTLQVETGSVTVARNGSTVFNAVDGSTTLNVGDTINLTDGSTARLTYGNGYVLQYVKPGVYVVAAAPDVATVATSAASQNAATLGVILGTAALGAAALDSMKNVNAEALSH